MKRREWICGGVCALALALPAVLPLVLVAMGASGVARAQTGSATAATTGAVGSAAMPSMGPIVLVLPFDNLTDPTQMLPQTMPQAMGAAKNGAAKSDTANAGGADHAGGPTVSEASEMVNLDWIREAAAEVLNQRLTSVGFMAQSREDRQYALEHLGLPENFQPSRATAMRVAETLDAGYVVIGGFEADGARLHLTARVIDGTKLHESRELVEDGEIAQLLPLLDGLAWQVARELNPNLDVSRETFVAASQGVRLDAFEQYVRGVTERDPAERETHLKRAVALSPELTEAWMALGREEFEQQEYEDAAAAFAHIGAAHQSALEADFYRGLALIYSGGYEQAQAAFAAIARVLPLPEVVNNEGVALSRRGADGTALYRQAEGSDPKDEDYHFNLALSLHRNGETAEARREMEQALKLNSADSEAREMLAVWGGPASDAAKTVAADSSQAAANGQAGNAADSQSGDDAANADVARADAAEVLERIKRQYDGAAFRQAAMMLDSVEAARIATLPPAEQAEKLSADAREKLDEGLLLEAESEYRRALEADSHCAQAHGGMAEVMERAGDAAGARKEAEAAQADGGDARADLVLARMNLAAGDVSAAEADVNEALRLDAKSRAARDLKKVIENRKNAAARE